MRAFRIMAGMVLCTVAFGVGAQQPATRACVVRFPGTAFLKAAYERGLEPKQLTQCHTVQTANNVFHAKPQVACDLFFRNAQWLPGNGKFRSMSGQGSFTATPDPNGYRISIKAGRGFYLTQVTIAVTGPFNSCSDVTLDFVLDGS